MSSASRGLAPREGLERLVDDGGPYGPCRGFVTADVLVKGLSRGAIATG